MYKRYVYTFGFMMRHGFEGLFVKFFVRRFDGSLEAFLQKTFFTKAFVQ